ncbi:MAG: 1,2-phenylacetyl-CoA epoxidase subunit PaaD [Lapillicoccus sp.]
MTTRVDAASLRAALGAVPDPEVPVVSVADLGILRSVEVDQDTGEAHITITPTYSGCPAMEAIRAHLEHVCRQQGWVPRVSTRLDPAWTTDWITEEGRDQLRQFGIAPPSPRGEGAGTGPSPRHPGLVVLELSRHVVVCPQCGSSDTTELAHFGSTACKALRRCNACREPFDEFKAI